MLEAEHLCMSMRGVQKAGASTMTSHFTGIFKDDAAEREKFLNLVRPTYQIAGARLHDMSSPEVARPGSRNPAGSRRASTRTA